MSALATRGRPMRRPQLVHLDDEELARRWRSGSDPRAADLLVRRYLPLARALARRYSHTSEPTEDLAQVACAGFVAALSRFDPDRGSSLRSFAIPTMLGELRKHFRDTGWSVHVSRAVQERVRLVQDAVDILAARAGRSPTVNELAEALRLTAEEVVEAFEARSAYRTDTLDSADPAEDDARDRRAWLAYDDGGFARAEHRVELSRALGALPDRERAIVKLRFDLELSQSEIGHALGISQMHVSRLLRRAMRRMEIVMRPEAPAGAAAARAVGPRRKM